MKTIFLVILAIILLISQEILKKKLKLEEYSKKAKEISEKIKKEGLKDEHLKEIVEVQKKMINYMIYSMIVFFIILLIVKQYFNEPIIYFPFDIPILNRNYLMGLGSFLLIYFLVSLIYNIVKKVLMKYGKWVKG